jgi:hypothetical protein
MEQKIKKTKEHIVECELVSPEPFMNNVFGQKHASRSYPAKANLLTGEVKTDFWVKSINNVVIMFNDVRYEIPVEGVGGKYFVVNYQEQPLFKNFFLHKQLQKDLKSSMLENATANKKAKL